MKKLYLLVILTFFMAVLSGCSVMRYLVTGDWNGTADLVVVSQNPSPIAAIALE